jgi:hypothetical protein
MFPFSPVVLRVTQDVPDEDLFASVADPSYQPAFVVANVEDDANADDV